MEPLSLSRVEPAVNACREEGMCEANAVRLDFEHTCGDGIVECGRHVSSQHRFEAGGRRASNRRDDTEYLASRAREDVEPVTDELLQPIRNRQRVGRHISDPAPIQITGEL